jgi:hypothetical protein
MALVLTRVHVPKINEEKLWKLSVVNPKGYNFRDYLETFIKAATRIADAIDLGAFIDPVDLADSPSIDAVGGSNA